MVKKLLEPDFIRRLRSSDMMDRIYDCLKSAAAASPDDRVCVRFQWDKARLLTFLLGLERVLRVLHLSSFTRCQRRRVYPFQIFSGDRGRA